MEYQVPQFIEVENRIIGPLTFKQFVYLAGGGGVCLIAFFYLPLIFAVLVALPVAALAGALAFYKINNKPFVEIMEAGFNYLIGGRLYLWKKEEKSLSEIARNIKAPDAPEARVKLGLNASKLHELARELDIKGPDA